MPRGKRLIKVILDGRFDKEINVKVNRNKIALSQLGRSDPKLLEIKRANANMLVLIPLLQILKATRASSTLSTVVDNELSPTQLYMCF